MLEIYHNVKTWLKPSLFDSSLAADRLIDKACNNKK